MNKRLVLMLLLATGLLNARMALAHGGDEHSHKPITEAQAKERAVAEVAVLSGNGKVEKLWTKQEPSIAKQKFGSQTEWVATFENRDAKELLKKRLYVFLSLSGEFLAANHTGK